MCSAHMNASSWDEEARAAYGEILRTEMQCQTGKCSKEHQEVAVHRNGLMNAAPGRIW